MHGSSARGVDPSRAEISLSLEETDLNAAFASGENKDLFFTLNQPRPAWEKLSFSAQLEVFAKVAKLAEDEFARREAEAVKAKG